MICHNLSEILGFACHPLSEDGSVAFIDSPLTFLDGNSLPIYLKRAGTNLYFFDDHETVYHYIKKGYRGDKERLDTAFIRSALSPYGLSFENNQISVWGSIHNAKEVFARYLSGLLAVSNLGVPERNSDDRMLKLIDEVATLLHIWKAGADIVIEPTYKGLSKTTYKLNFRVDKEAIVIATPNPHSIGSALRKMVDIAGADNSVQFRVILEDRFSTKEHFDAQGTILSTMATVMSFSELKREAAELGSIRH